MSTVSQQLQGLGYGGDYNSRANLYKQWGLGGNFSGTAQQNISLLNAANQRGKASTGSTTTASSSSGGAFPSYADYNTAVNKYTSDYGDLLSGQNKQQSDLYDAYGNAIKSQEPLDAAYKRIAGEQGIPDLQKTSQALKDQLYSVKGLLNQLPEDLNQRTAGTFTSDAQKNRVMAVEGGKLNTQLGTLGTALAPTLDALGTAQTNTSNQLGFLQNQQSKELSGYQMQISQLSDKFARETTGFTTTHEAQLNNLLSQISRGQQLSDMQWQAAQTLALKEKEFANNRSITAMNLKNNIDMQNLKFDQQKSLYSLASQNPFLPGSSAGSTGNPLLAGGPKGNSALDNLLQGLG